MNGAQDFEEKCGASIRRIRTLLKQALLKDRAYAGRKLRALLDNGPPSQETKAVLEALAALERRLEESIREKETRIERRPPLRYPRGLPILARRHDIVRAIKDQSVVIISGETGCGKSTQIPKMCLEAGRGAAGKIGCTQPRRIAAITIAHRIAEELGERLGRSVGYKIRFQDRAPKDAYIKVVTDGMLLAEIRSDPRLYDYDTLIIDEAHERSLNIDFLLGISRTLLNVRPEFKLVITSATLDTEKFSRAFSRAPVIRVGGRMYPVEVEYEPEDEAHGMDEDIIDKAVAAVAELKSRHRTGDILIFMPTEQDILETCERLGGKHDPGTTILPLYARLPAAQQGRVFGIKGSKIVVATNVAETSLTIPGIRTVIDTGLARLSQYQPETRINSLPISPISRASADQRMGRCGRVQEGFCLRLYSRKDYESRPEFTSPEILRSNLAEVILRMLDLGLGHPSEFPFVDAPPPRSVKDGFETLLELGAISGKGRDFMLTALGRGMAPMPLDPRISRMLLTAEREGCPREVAVIASVLSIRDPRERPPDKAAEADAKHALFKHPHSDFLSLLNIWDRYERLKKESASRNKLKHFCRESFLSYPRMREWGLLHDQVLSILEEQKVRLGRRQRLEMSEELYTAIHRSVLSGFLSNIAVHKEKNLYTAAKGREVMVFPGSALFGQSHLWIVAAEMVRTSRLFARTAARIDPAWLEDLGGRLCRYSYSEPRWDRRRGEVTAKERVALFGLEIVPGRTVSYGRINSEEAHRIFVHSALVEGGIEEPPPFLKCNLELTKTIAGMEEKLRRRDILVDEEEMAGFYSLRLAGIHDLRGLDLKLRKEGNDGFLRMSPEDLMRVKPEEDLVAAYPETVDLDGRLFRAVYRFAPGEEADGVTLKIPAALIKSIPAEPLEWGVPGQYKEKILALLKGLPKRYRKLLMPASEKAEIIIREMKPEGPSLFATLARFVKRKFQVDIPALEWAKADLPPHLRMRIAVTDHEGREIAAARNLDILRQAAVPAAGTTDSPALKSAKERWERTGLATWDFEPLPESVAAGPHSIAFPGLEAAENGVNIRLFKTREEALTSHVKGVEALFAPRFAKDLEFVRRCLNLPEEYDSATLSFGGKAAVMRAMTESLKNEVFQKNIRNREAFEAHAAVLVRTLFEKGTELRDLVLKVLDAHKKVGWVLPRSETAAPGSARPQAPSDGAGDAFRSELARLAPTDFLRLYRLERLRHLPRYLDALRIRAERAKNNPEKDGKKADQIEPFTTALERLRKNISKETSAEKKSALEEFSDMIEEFRVSLFAPELKTAYPVSPKRLALKIKDIEAME